MTKQSLLNSPRVSVLIVSPRALIQNACKWLARSTYILTFKLSHRRRTCLSHGTSSRQLAHLRQCKYYSSHYRQRRTSIKVSGAIMPSRRSFPTVGACLLGLHLQRLHSHEIGRFSFSEEAPQWRSISSICNKPAQSRWICQFAQVGYTCNKTHIINYSEFSLDR